MQTDLATRLEELAGRVTPGPWRATGLPYNGLDDPVIVGGPSETYVCQTVYDMQSMTTEHDVHADTELIALLGSHLPDIIAALRAGEWQPIETAPKSQAVLIFVPKADWPENLPAGTTLVAYQTDHGEGFHDSWRYATGEGRGRPCGYPTHWRPLPTPPAKETPTND